MLKLWSFTQSSIYATIIPSWSSLRLPFRIHRLPCIFQLGGSPQSSTARTNLAGSAGLVRYLRSFFATFLIPEEISSDGDREFIAKGTQNFLRFWGVHSLLRRHSLGSARNLPASRNVSYREHFLPFVCSRPDHGWRSRENYLCANRRWLIV